MRVMRVTGNEYCDEISLFHFFPVARPTIVMARWIGSNMKERKQKDFNSILSSSYQCRF
jgi:hypothetical protein